MNFMNKIEKKEKSFLNKEKQKQLLALVNLFLVMKNALVFYRFFLDNHKPLLYCKF